MSDPMGAQPARANRTTTFSNQTSSRARVAPILISDGDKGGAGKSFLARILAYLLTNAGHEWSGFDLDPRNGHLLRFHQGMEVTQVDWTDPTGWNRLYDAMMAVDPSRVLLIDLPAQVGTLASREFPRLLATANYLKRPVYRFWSLGREFDSVNLLAQTLDLVVIKNTFVVLNLRAAAREDFTVWNGGKTQERFLQANGMELILPALSSGVAGAIEEADLSFHKAMSTLKQPYFLFDIEAYLNEVEREFAPLMERLA